MCARELTWETAPGLTIGSSRVRNSVLWLRMKNACALRGSTSRRRRSMLRAVDAAGDVEKEAMIACRSVLGELGGERISQQRIEDRPVVGGCGGDGNKPGNGTENRTEREARRTVKGASGRDGKPGEGS